MENKIIKISDAGPDCQITNNSFYYLEKYFREGWVVKAMTSWKEQLIFVLERKKIGQ